MFAGGDGGCPQQKKNELHSTIIIFMSTFRFEFDFQSINDEKKVKTNEKTSSFDDVLNYKTKRKIEYPIDKGLHFHKILLVTLIDTISINQSINID